MHPVLGQMDGDEGKGVGVDKNEGVWCGEGKEDGEEMDGE